MCPKRLDTFPSLLCPHPQLLLKKQDDLLSSTCLDPSPTSVTSPSGSLGTHHDPAQVTLSTTLSPAFTAEPHSWVTRTQFCQSKSTACTFLRRDQTDKYTVQKAATQVLLAYDASVKAFVEHSSSRSANPYEVLSHTYSGCVTCTPPNKCERVGQPKGVP